MLWRRRRNSANATTGPTDTAPVLVVRPPAESSPVHGISPAAARLTDIPRPVSTPELYAIIAFPFKGGQPDELDVAAGSIVQIINVNGEWAVVRRVEDGAVGLVPLNHLKNDTAAEDLGV